MFIARATHKYLKAPEGRHVLICLNHRFGRLKDCTDKAENGKVKSVGVGSPNPSAEVTSPLRLRTYRSPANFDSSVPLAPAGRHVYSTRDTQIS